MAKHSEPSGKTASEEGVEASEGSSSQFQPFCEAGRRYVETSAKLQRDIWRRLVETEQEHARSICQLRKDFQKRTAEIDQEAHDKLKEAQQQPDVQDRIYSILSDRNKALHEAWVAAQNDLAKICDELADSWHKTKSDIRSGYEENYQNYLQAAQRAWANLDVKTADPVLLYNITQTHFAAAVLGQTMGGISR